MVGGGTRLFLRFLLFVLCVTVFVMIQWRMLLKSVASNNNNNSINISGSANNGAADALHKFLSDGILLSSTTTTTTLQQQQQQQQQEDYSSNPDPFDFGLNGSTVENGVVLAGVFSFQKDPRFKCRQSSVAPNATQCNSATRDTVNSGNYETIYHLHQSALFHKVRVVFVHDVGTFNQAFRTKYTVLPYTRFYEVPRPTPAQERMGVLHYRYVGLNRYLQERRAAGDFDQVDWLVYTDLDAWIASSNIWKTFQQYRSEQNKTFTGSFEGGVWASPPQRKINGKELRHCFKRHAPHLLENWTKATWDNTANGCCGLFGGAMDQFACILQCMASFFEGPFQNLTRCDMATHDYCVQFGNCIPRNQLRWGQETLGTFGPPYGGRPQRCTNDEHLIVHNRCFASKPICFREEQRSVLVSSQDGSRQTELHTVQTKYLQNGYEGRLCRLDKETDLPLPNRN